MTEFDYQWKNLPSAAIEYNELRIAEFLSFTGLGREFFKGKIVLDAGCGNGRYTFAMQELGAIVDSIDISEEAVKACKRINPQTRILSVFDVSGEYDFILSWGVLHHTADPEAGFRILADQLIPGGVLHIMLYEKSTQAQYKELRKKFRILDQKGKLAMCRELSK
ncbi:class I SAM-dependent methyltransferase, partial [Candidatus Pacearchaeota archaeon]|nr:class I SAM-dependent methyltransferase [Candidatus Pacearchaeota archaeon]